MKNFLEHNDKTKSEMLDAIGLKRVEDLFSQIPQEARMANLNLPKALSEMETQNVV